MLNEVISSFPMGPKLREFLDISPENYRGESLENPSDKEVLQFTQYVCEVMNSKDIAKADDLEDLLDETVSMDLPLLTLKLAEKYGKVFSLQSFRAINAEAIAAMLTGELEQAEFCFAKAHELYPDEPGPYVNLTKILLNQDRDEEAEKWALAGLTLEKNNHRLWEAYYLWADKHFEQNDEKVVLAIAEKSDHFHSWVGKALQAEISPQRNSDTSSLLLTEFYNQGERSNEFIVEYSGALGMSGDFDKMLQVIWEAESKAKSPKDVPWKLLLHKGQALLSMNRDDEGLACLRQLLENPILPAQAKEPLSKMVSDLETEIAERPQAES